MTFGPWTPNLNHAERVARLRAMRALALLLCRPHSNFIKTLQQAETDPGALPAALDLLDHLPALRRRHLLAAYGQLIGGGR